MKVEITKEHIEIMERVLILIKPHSISDSQNKIDTTTKFELFINRLKREVDPIDIKGGKGFIEHCDIIIELEQLFIKSNHLPEYKEPLKNGDDVEVKICDTWMPGYKFIGPNPNSVTGRCCVVKYNGEIPSVLIDDIRPNNSRTQAIALMKKYIGEGILTYQKVISALTEIIERYNKK